MKSRWMVVLTISAFLLGLSACAKMSGVFAKGEKDSETPFESPGLKLTSMDLPDTIEVGVPYEVKVTFEAEGEPPIRKVCLRWVRERTGKGIPSVYCYVFEGKERMGRENACIQWLAGGTYAQFSPLYCTQPENVKYGQGTFAVTLSTSNVKTYYQTLECHVEYVYEAKIRKSNTISTPITVLGE